MKIGGWDLIWLGKSRPYIPEWFRCLEETGSEHNISEMVHFLIILIIIIYLFIIIIRKNTPVDCVH